MEEPTKDQAKRPAKAPAPKPPQADAKPATKGTPRGATSDSRGEAPRDLTKGAPEDAPHDGAGDSPGNSAGAKPAKAAKKSKPRVDAGRREGEPAAPAPQGKPKKTSAATTTARRDATTAVPTPTPGTTPAPKPPRKRATAKPTPAKDEPSPAKGEPTPAPRPKPTPKERPQAAPPKDATKPRPAPPANRPHLRVLEQLEIPLPEGAITVNGAGPATPAEPQPATTDAKPDHDLDHAGAPADSVDHSDAGHAVADRGRQESPEPSSAAAETETEVKVETEAEAATPAEPEIRAEAVAEAEEMPSPATDPRPAVPRLTEAEILAWLPPADPATARRSRWSGVLGDRFDPELAARAAVRELGPVAATKVEKLRLRYPAAPPAGIARLAAHEAVKDARRAAADPVAAVRGLLIPREQALLVLTIAAACGLDPASPLRAPEVLDLLRVPRLTPTRRELTNLARSVSTIAVRAVAARLVPFGGPAAGAVQGGRSATDLAHRALRFYAPR